MKLLSIIIPCFNEEETVEKCLVECQKIEQLLAEELKVEYIFINDGSKDRTLDILRKLSNAYLNVHYLSFSRNFGKEAGLLAGLEEAKGDFLVVMDADLQDPPELLPEMYRKMQEGYDVVGTRRINRKGEPIIRSFFSRLFYYLIKKISNTEMVDGERDFRMMTRQVVDSILELQEVNRFSKGLFSWVGYDVTHISYENRDRSAGQTSWNFWALVRYSIDGFINFSEAPLTLATWFGFLTFMLAMLAILVIVVRKLIFGDPVSGWASTVSIILFMGGIQLMALGIIGKYLVKIFLETKKRPIYIVKEKG